MHFCYCVAFDGVKIASGGLDSTVRVWDAETGYENWLYFLFYLSKILIQKKSSIENVSQGHSALVCQLQLSLTILATGGSDGRVIAFSLETYTALHTGFFRYFSPIRQELFGDRWK